MHEIPLRKSIESTLLLEFNAEDSNILPHIDRAGAHNLSVLVWLTMIFAHKWIRSFKLLLSIV